MEIRRCMEKHGYLKMPMVCGKALMYSIVGDDKMAVTSEKTGKVAARILAGGSYTDAEVKQLAGSVVRQKEKKQAKKALRSVGVT